MESALKCRRSARLMIVSPGARLLLFRYEDEHQAAFWATPGGELLAGECFVDAAQRELFEETGFTTAVGKFLRERRATYAVARSKPARWLEHYYSVWVPRETSIPKCGWTEGERATIANWRWWSLSEMRQSDEVFKPTWIPQLFSDMLENLETE